MIKDNSKKQIALLAALIAAGAVFTFIWFALFGNADQVYTDVVSEYTAESGSNKSAERQLIYILSFGGMIIYALFNRFFIKKQDDEGTETSVKDGASFDVFAIGAIFISAMAVSLIIYKTISPILLCFLFYLFIVSYVDRSSVRLSALLYFTCLYAFIGLYRILVFLGLQADLSDTFTAITATIISFIPFIFKDKRTAIKKSVLIGQIVVPSVLFIFLAGTYEHRLIIYHIYPPTILIVTILILIAAFIFEAVFKLIKEWADENGPSNLITVGFAASVMTFNRYCGAGVIMRADNHHPFENIIDYSQIFKLGRIPFKDFVPVSGMFSVVQGAFFDIFGKGGLYSYYNVTSNLFYLTFIILTVYLLSLVIDREHLFYIALIFPVLDYNRVTLLFPSVVLLLLPAIRKRRGLFLMMWYLTGLLNGLYYPLYGGALVLSFAPYAVYLGYTYIKEGELKKDIKKPAYICGIIACVALFILSFNALKGTFNHMRAMSGQTVYADGISRFGQKMAENFIPYAADAEPGFRAFIFCFLTFVIPALFIWIGFALSCRIKKTDMEGFTLSLVPVIMPLIAFSYTFIRTEANSIFVRSAHVLYASALAMTVIAYEKLKNKDLRLSLLCFCVAMIALGNNIGLSGIDTDEKLKGSYHVKDDYCHLTNYWGEGFADVTKYADIESTRMNFENKDKNASYLGDPWSYGHYYMIGVKGSGPIELGQTVKGYRAADEAIDFAKKQGSYIGPSFVTTYRNYYMFNYLVASGEYMWDPENRNFKPVAEGTDIESVYEINRTEDISKNNTKTGKVPSSWGSSMKSLENIFAEPEIMITEKRYRDCVDLTFDKTVYGNDADFIYLEFKGMDSEYTYALEDKHMDENLENPKGPFKYMMKKIYNPGTVVKVEWTDNDGNTHSMESNMGKGKLLIPLGAGSRWLLDDHNEIRVSVRKDGNEDIVPEISECRLLKLREAGRD